MSDRTAMPVVSGAQMAAVDRAMVDVCGLDLLQVMEVAGRAVAAVARRLTPGGRIDILCGHGGNGGDALVAARYLTGWGYDVECWLSRPTGEFRGLAGHNLSVCQHLGLPIHEPDASIGLGDATLIIDGIFGFGLTSSPTGRPADLIEAANMAAAPVLAIDLPSGVDATTGVAFEPAIDATFTVTLGLPKLGLVQRDGPDRSGTVIVADIGIPAAAYAAAGIARTDLFEGAELVLLDGAPWLG